MDEPTPEPPAPPPAPEPPPDPLALLAEALDRPGAAEQIAALSELDLARLVSLSVERAQERPDRAAQDRLAALRLGVLQANARSALLRVLGAQAELAATLGDIPARLQALERRVGLLDLLREAERAWRAQLALADALIEAEELPRAQLALQDALQRAQALAPGGKLRLASGCSALTLVRLARVAALQGQPELAQTWTEGARELAQKAEPEVRDEVEAGLARG